MNREPGSPSGESKAEVRRVLVVDDEPDVLDYLSAALSDRGFIPLEARSAEEALRRVERERPDLIILDIMLKGKSGLSLYRALKQDPRWRHIPAFFLSGFARPEDFRGERFRRLVAESEELPEPEACFEKPVKLDELFAKMEAVLAKDRERKE